MGYYLGIDGGGTKTHFMLCDEAGHIRGEAFLGSTSYRAVGIEGVMRTACEGVQALLAPLGDRENKIISVGWGLPYYGEFVNEDAKLRELASEFLPGARKYLCNDVEVGMAGSLTLHPGAHIVAGTGAIAMAMDETGRTARCGGWHEHFSDEGSGYWLGLQTLNLFTKQADGRLPAGLLLKELRAAFDLSSDIDLNQYYVAHLMGDRKRIAQVQLVLEAAARAGDKDAVALYVRAAEELLTMAEGAAQALDMAITGLVVSYFGGVFKAGELVLSPLRESCKRIGVRLARPLLSPAAGAVLLAVREACPEYLDGMRAVLTEEQKDTGK